MNIRKKDLDRVIDLRIQKTESEYSFSLQDFFERGTELWFKWIGWIFSTGAIAFVAKKTSSTPLFIIELISYILVCMYFLYYFGSIRIEPYYSWATNQKSKIRRLLAVLPILIIIIIMATGSRILIFHIIEQIQKG